MLEALLLRFDAPLMSFGGVTVDQHGVTREYPARSMLAGLLSNALGYDHRDADRLGSLQTRLRFAVRKDRSGEALVDFQTVALGQEFLLEGWTTARCPEGRGGGPAKTGTHIRHRHYWADSVSTVVLTLEPDDERPTLDDLAAALAEPARPLFIGRKPCLPAAPLLLGRLQGESLFDLLQRAPRIGEREDPGARLKAWWPDDEREPQIGRALPVTDERDWRNQVHVGRRFIREGAVMVEEARDE